jgi:hypothetical protein
MARDLQPCGTPAAAQRHRYRGEEMCEPCAAAQRAYDESRYQPRERAHQPCGTYAAYMRHKRRREDVDDACRDAQRKYRRDFRGYQQPAINVDPTPVPEPLESIPMPIPGYVVAAFAPLPHVCAGQDLTREHAVCLDAYRRACGLPAWLDQSADADVTVTAAAVNQAVTWWNGWHGTKGADGA